MLFTRNTGNDCRAIRFESIHAFDNLYTHMYTWEIQYLAFSQRKHRAAIFPIGLYTVMRQSEEKMITIKRHRSLFYYHIRMPVLCRLCPKIYSIDKLTQINYLVVAKIIASQQSRLGYNENIRWIACTLERTSVSSDFNAERKALPGGGSAPRRGARGGGGGCRFGARLRGRGDFVEIWEKVRIGRAPLLVRRAKLDKPESVKEK